MANDYANDQETSQEYKEYFRILVLQAIEWYLTIALILVSGRTGTPYS